MTSLLRRLLPLLLVLGWALPVKAQYMENFDWHVHHNSTAWGVTTAMEATRATLEKSIAVQHGWASVLWSQAVAAENYSWLRGYVSLLRTARMAKQVMRVLGTTQIPLYTLLPSVRIVAPVEFTDPNTGGTLVREREIASLSLVPQRYQVGWTFKGAFGDDEYSGATDLAGGGGGPNPPAANFITVQFPSAQGLANAFSVAPSPFLTDSTWDAEDSFNDIQAHFFEGILEAASRLAGYGVQVNPMVLADGASLMSGRLSPAAVTAQATLYQQQAFTILNKLMSIYTAHGAEYQAIERLQKRDRAYWEEFPSLATTQGTARIAFAMNAMNEIHQVMSRMENYEHRARQNESDEALANLGKKKDPSGDWVPMWEPDAPPARQDFYMIMDKLTGSTPWAKAVTLQANGLSARYSYAGFQEAEGLRNTLMGMLRLRIALDGIAVNSRTLKEIRQLDRSTLSVETFTDLLSTYARARSSQSATGWGGLKFDWKGTS